MLAAPISHLMLAPPALRGTPNHCMRYTCTMKSCPSPRAPHPFTPHPFTSHPSLLTLHCTYLNTSLSSFTISFSSSFPTPPTPQIVCFYDKDGMQLQRFDFSRDESEKEFTAAAFNPSGETVVVGSFNRFRTFTLNQVALAPHTSPPRPLLPILSPHAQPGISLFQLALTAPR